MDHPNIARVLDAGATDTGRPYFVMELVQGVPITDYCDQPDLTPARAARAVRPGLPGDPARAPEGDHPPRHQAVQRAGDRDRDGKPVPKVIDFGVAKAIDQRLTERDACSPDLGAVVGTLGVHEPRAGRMDELDIDTRSDIYSLGVLLYELLTGTTPLERPALREAAYAEVLRRIREEEPPRPSLRLRDRGDALPSIAAPAQDRTGPADEAGAGRARLDRDEGAREGPRPAIRDGQRPGARHRALPRRRAGGGRPAVGELPAPKSRGSTGCCWRTSAAFAVVLLAATAASIGLAARARRAERSARDQAAIARAVSDFLQTDLLAQANTYEQTGRDATPDPDIKVRTLLDRASRRVGDRFPDQPAVGAAISRTIGDTYEGLGLHAEARPHLERAFELLRRALGREHPDTQAAMSSLARVYRSGGQYDQAEPLLKDLLELQSRVLGPEHPDTLTSLDELATLHQGRGRYDQAEALFRRALDGRRRVLGPEHPLTLKALNDLAVLYEAQGQYDRAEPFYQQTLEGDRRVFGPEHPNTLETMHNLAQLYRFQGKNDRAEPLYQRVVELAPRVLGPEHPTTLIAMDNLGELYRSDDRLEQAEPLYVRALEGDAAPSVRSTPIR